MAPTIKPTTALARKLRRNLTDAEQKLWLYLRMRQLDDVKFRRQEPLGGYVVDFCSFDPKIVIELDGGQHADEEEYDNERTYQLERMGYRVLRFWNNDVIANVEGVFATIAVEVERLASEKPK